MKSRTIPVVTAALALALAFPLTVRTDDKDKDKDKDKNRAPQDIIVNFGDPVILAGAANQVLVPDDSDVRKGGTVTFVVNAVARHRDLSGARTPREDITACRAHDPTTAPAWIRRSPTPITRFGMAGTMSSS